MSIPEDEKIVVTIEQTQAVLRESIEQAKALASESERLIRRNRDEMVEEKPPNPAT